MFRIDPMSRTPIYEQLTAQAEKFVLLGAMQAGYQLPSVRALSSELSINPNTVQKAYNDLCSRGVLVSVPGRGCFVAEDALDRIKAQSRARLGAFETMVRELKLAGIEKDDLTAMIDELYEGRSEGDVASTASDQTI